jgi:hypothetical protein
VALYDRTKLFAFERSLGRPSDLPEPPPFPYPPIALLVFWPLGYLPYALAFAAWIAATLAAYLLAAFWRLRGSSRYAAIALISTTTSVEILYGQTGFLTSALMVGGLRLAVQRPLLAGLLLGLLAFKPQLGILIPVALIAAGLWRPVVVAMASLLGLVVLTALLFGWGTWPRWLAILPDYSALFAANIHPYLGAMPTVAGNLQALGFEPALAQACNAIVAIVVVSLVWTCCRRGLTRLSLAAVLTGTLLCTPHAFSYDMAIVTIGMLYLVQEVSRDGKGFGALEQRLLAVGFLLPGVMAIRGLVIPFGSVTMGCVLVMIWRRRRPASPKP